MASTAPAKVYPFKLDAFQQDAVNHIENGDSVLVAAHTSAGKTAVAEYAIAKSLRDKQRVIYTSPIKALSNQKYREMHEEFHDVGLMTGDMTLNPSATCLIMTTEILRSMLYRGSEIMREVAWVIYDEVHYMRDKERGVVWEESIILLPHKVRFVFLSATIPNAEEFVAWVSKLHHQPCHVVYTDYRPVPLEHNIWIGSQHEPYLVVDDKGRFVENNFQKAMGTMEPDEDIERPSKKIKKFTSNEATDIGRIVNIVFSFSKRDCETYAKKVFSRFDFNNDDEKDLVEQVFSSALESLSEDDKSLLQVVALLPLLKRGIGIHHGGLLPILKEVIEILFQEGLIKFLFATETFSIGINMPAKTVVFTSTRKFDGESFRWISSGEYIQMSGRAGRRGKDTKGIVIQMIDEKMEPDALKDMIYGESDPLMSSYHVSYSMVLNMMRVEDADPEDLLRRSFHQYQQEVNSHPIETQAEEYQREASSIVISDESVFAEFYSWYTMSEKCKEELKLYLQKVEYALPFLQSGRLVYIKAKGRRSDGYDSEGAGDVDYGWGVVVVAKKLITDTKPKQIIGDIDSKDPYILDILLEVSTGGEDDEDGDSPRELKILQASFSAIHEISAVKLKLPPDLTKLGSRKSVQRAIEEVERRFLEAGSIPLLDPIKDMGINAEAFMVLIDKSNDLQQRMKASPVLKISGYEATLDEYKNKVKLLESARLLRAQAKEMKSIAMKDDLRKMKKVLRRLGYISNEGVLATKGRFACELTTGEELVLTDMIFDGIFNELNVDQAVGLLSCFAHEEPVKESGKKKIRSDLEAAYQKMQAIARNIATVSADAKITINEDEYVNSFNPAMVDVAYSWSHGSKFVDICKLADNAIFEGSIIRSLRRLDELLRQLASASAAIGNIELKNKFEEGSTKIRRGVVFAASLYM